MQNSSNPSLSDEVRRVFKKHGDGYRPLSFAKASEISGVSTTMLNNLAHGKNVGCEGVIRFALAFEEDVPYWLRLCGYDDIADFMESCQGQKTERESRYDEMLNKVPVSKRRQAEEDAERFIEGWIIPRYSKVAA